MTELFRVSKVARWLDVTKKRVYHLIQEGKLEAVRLGPRQMRISRDSLEAYMQRLRKERQLELGLCDEQGLHEHSANQRR
jgi:excisionase family DNA binding protein